jgi:hypothetical protein
LELYQKYPDYMYRETSVIAFSPFILYYVRSRDHRVSTCQLYCEDLVHTWVTSGAETAPAFLRFGTPLWDWLLQQIQSRINPWVSGVSMVGPRYTMFNPKMKERWHSRGISVYLWGFPDPSHCTAAMRVPGVFVACDDQHEAFKTPKPAPNFDIFGDEQRAREEAANQKKLS